LRLSTERCPYRRRISILDRIMSGGDDLKSHAVNSSDDFYDLLSITSTANESEIRRAYRKTALKYHPDKVGASDKAALDKFHDLQIAYDVLSDPGVRELYDNARRAREEKKQRDAAFEGRRKWMKEDLERRESGVFKRKREEAEEEQVFERELKRLAEDGKRRRKEREEQLRQEMVQQEEEEHQKRDGDEEVQTMPQQNGDGPAEIDRSVTLRFPKNARPEHMDRDRLVSLFQRFGPIEDAVLRDKKLKLDGEKHRQPYTTAVLVFKSIVGAHAAITDVARLQCEDAETWGLFAQVGWASGKEPDYIPKPATPSSKPMTAESLLASEKAVPITPSKQEGNFDGVGLRKVPSFGSFKVTPKSTPRGVNSPRPDEITMIRLKNAERKRMEEKIRREEADTAATAAASGGD